MDERDKLADVGASVRRAAAGARDRALEARSQGLLRRRWTWRLAMGLVSLVLGAVGLYGVLFLGGPAGLFLLAPVLMAYGAHDVVVASGKIRARRALERRL